MAPRRTLTLTAEEKQALIDHRDHDPRPYVRERCAALLKIASGRVPYWVAKHGLLKQRHPDAVYGWLNNYEVEGLAGIIGYQHGGNRYTANREEEELAERLQYAPGPAAQAEQGLSPTVNVARWTLRTIRATFDWMSDYTLSGVWQVLKRNSYTLRSVRIRQYSPDPDYVAKVDYLNDCLHWVAANPTTHVLVFMDEMGYYRWPATAVDWMPAAPHLADTRQPVDNNQQWRIIGAVDAWMGQVTFLDGYIVGRQKVIELYEKLDRVYPDADHIYVVQDNWSIHKHQDVMDAVERLPRIEPVWLPTYAPWLNPIEKLWRWLRQDVLNAHRLVHDWKALQAMVRDFLRQFADGSSTLLHYIGLLGDGKLAQARRGA